MPWITLTEDHVLSRLSNEERDVMEAAGEGTSEGEDTTARLPGILLQVTALVRGKVAACSKNVGRMGPSGTIPEECTFAATTISREALVASQPTPEGMTDPRKEEIRQAYAFLDKIASCDVSIADNSGNYPGEPVTTPSSPLYGGCPKLYF